MALPYGTSGRRRGRALGLGLAATMGLSMLAGGPAYGADLPDRGGSEGRTGEGRELTTLADRAGAPQTFFVQFDTASALDAFNVAGKQASLDARRSIEAEADRIVDRAETLDARAQEVYRTVNAVPGVVLQITPQVAAEIAADPDVVAVLPVVNKELHNIGAVELTETLAQWTSTGYLGEGVKVGIIDTGVDYTHTGFGGPGTQEAFDAANAPGAQNNLDWVTDKVVGGYDFAGDAYNGQNLPQPDLNPLDCHGHGSHVAGSAAGFGVNADGTTFAGDYLDLTAEALHALRIGPGTAPLADVYALRVFGCGGSTGLVMQALDWSLDPDGDGDFSDRLDVINMSLGSSFGIADDPETLFVDYLAENGVVTVSSAGNEGDTTHIGGSPGNAVRGITVANTVAGRVSLDQIIVAAPEDLAGTYGGQFSVAYNYAGLDLGPLEVVELASVQADNPEGCLAYSPEAVAAVAGKAVWVEWPIDWACGSAVRANNATGAGAAAILFSSEEEIFSAGLSGNASTPLFQFIASGTDAVRPALTAGTLQVAFDGDLRGLSSPVAGAADTINSSTSRGAHNIVKPDVSAPGTLIGSVGVGTGNGVAVMSGTSMAAPHAAGIVALVRDAHPDWSVEQVKAAVMNTADHDLYTGFAGTGDVYGPNRVGAGRVDATGAVTTSLLAYADAGTGRVSASFGTVQVPIDGGELVLTKDVTVENLGDEAVTAAVDYVPATSQPGVDFSLSATSVTVAPGATATVTVTATIDPEGLRKTLDPTMDRFLDFGWGDLARAYIADASGRLTLTPNGSGSALRVPVHVAAEPASTTTASLVAGDGFGTIAQTGTGVLQGVVGTDSYVGVAGVYELVVASPRIPDCEDGQTSGCAPTDGARHADIRHVGVASDFPVAGDLEDTWVSFALTTWADRPTTGTNNFITFYIATADDLFAAQVTPFTDGVDDYDVYWSDLYRWTGTGFSWWSDSWMGELDHGFGVKIHDTNLLTFGYPAEDFFPDGFPEDPADAVLEVYIEAESYFAAPDDDYLMDTAEFTFSVGDPGLWSEVNFDVDDEIFTTDVFRAEGSEASHVMVTHSQGSERARADILAYKDGSPTDFTAAIDWFVAEGLTSGTAAGFRPADGVSRQAMAAFLYRYANGADPAPACTEAPFTDVSTSHPFCGEIAWLAGEGISTGYSDGSFAPGAPISRQAMAAFLERFAGAPMSETQSCVASSGFGDVAQDSAFCQSIRWLTAETGVASGYPDGLFRPGGTISRQAMASFLWNFDRLVQPRPVFEEETP